MLAIASVSGGRPEVPTVSGGYPRRQFAVVWHPGAGQTASSCKLNQEIIRARSPEVEKFVTEQSAEILTATPEGEDDRSR
jgi:hypothetical protein